MLSAKTLLTLARDEITQLREEGCETGVLEELLATCEGAPPDAVQDRLGDFFEISLRLRPTHDFPYREPSELDAIRVARPRDLERWDCHSLTEDWLRDRLTGAWLGRCIGCMIGKPVEGQRRGAIERILRAADAYPLEGYFPALETVPEGVAYKPASDECLAPNITRSVRDDDTDYTVLGLMLAEESGGDPASEGVVSA